MEYKTVYQTTGMRVPIDLLIVGVLLLVSLLFLYFCVQRRVKIQLYVIPVVVFAISAILLSSLLPSLIDQKKQIYDKYVAGKFEICEGKVSEFHAMPPEEHDSESFFVNGILFVLPNWTDWGYSTYKKDGGFITGDGEKVKITYMPYEGYNVILKIETVV